jgi:hypothetical protein
MLTQEAKRADGKPRTRLTLPGDREFESTSLQRRVGCELGPTSRVLRRDPLFVVGWQKRPGGEIRAGPLFSADPRWPD